MQFTVNASVRQMGHFRLQADNTFRKVSVNRRMILKTDQQFKSPQEAYDRIGNLGAEVEIENQKIPTNSEYGRFLNDTVADLGLHVHRTLKSPVPSRSQLVEAIRHADDSHNNFLSLDLEGRFEVVRFDTADQVHPIWAVRHESFAAGNDYAGPDAANATHYMDELYRDMLAGWLEHLETGELNCYVDTGADVTTKELVSKIRHWGQKKKAVSANVNS